MQHLPRLITLLFMALLLAGCAGRPDISPAAISATSPKKATGKPINPGKPLSRSLIAYTALQYGTWSRDLWLMNGDGTGKRQLTHDMQVQGPPAWSPDGTKIAFASWYRDPSVYNPEVYVINVDGTGLTNLTNQSGADQMPVWSPDGTQIAFHRGGMIHLMGADGSGKHALATSGTYASWSPDSSQIALCHDGDIFTINVDGTGETRLTNNPVDIEALGVAQNSCFPEWSPNGDQIAFGTDTTINMIDPYPGIEYWTSGDLELIDTDGTNRTLLERDNEYNPDFSWSPNGRQIVRMAGGNHIYVTDAATPFSSVWLTEPGTRSYHPSWSNDGKRIVWGMATSRTEYLDIWVMNTDGSGKVNLTNSPTVSEFYPKWSPR